MACSMPPDATAFNEDKALMTGPASTAGGPVDQLEDRYLGMVEAVGSNPTRSTFPWGGTASGPEDRSSDACQTAVIVADTGRRSGPGSQPEHPSLYQTITRCSKLY